VRPEESPRPSLLFRALLAVGLTVAFYALALGIAGLLLTFAWFNLHARHPQARAILFAVIGAGMILWSVFPRREKFTSPGPRLLPGTQPRLFRELHGIAKGAGQAMPAEVYLVPELNAGVLQRGGILGIGGRRVMVLGLPLLTALRVSEFRGVLAHEFGHYHGGETSLGPWIYQTQSAIGRTVRSLSETGSLLRFIFLWYGKAFLRITLAISRRQELAADRLAARVAGAPAIASGLRRIHGVDPFFQSFFGQEVVPVLASGFRPPIAEGFQQFLRVEAISAAVDKAVDHLVKEGKGDPYDSHPPLRERLEALGNPAPLPADPEDPRAASLLEDLDGLEKALLDAAFPGRTKSLTSVTWPEAGTKVFVPLWRKAVEEGRTALRGLTPATLPSALAGAPGDSRWRKKKEADPRPAGASPLIGVGGSAMLLLLLDRGWALHCVPGADVSVSDGSTTFLPFREIKDLAEGKTDAAQWAERCRALAIADVPLEPPAPAAPKA
jgi:Zn-dependent protease with chaperone function